MSYPNTPYPNDPYGQGAQQPGQGAPGGYPPPHPGHPQQGGVPGGPPAPYGGQQPGGYPPPPGAPQTGGYQAHGGYDQSQQPGGYPPPPPVGQYGQPGQYGGYAPGGYGGYNGQPTPDEQSTAVLTHIGGALTGWLIPLIILVTKKDESPFNRDQAVQALNFQLPLMIGYFISIILSFVLIGALTGLGIFIYSLVYSIKGASAVKQGEWYRYPFSVNWVR